MTYNLMNIRPARRPRTTGKRKPAGKAPEQGQPDLSAPVTIEPKGDPHPNAFAQLPKGTTVAVRWPKL